MNASILKLRFSKSVIAVCIVIPLSACETLETKEGLGSLIGAVAGYHVVKEGGGNKNAKLAGALAGLYVGKQIGKKLDEEDRARMAASMQRSLVSGESANWSNAKNKTSGQSRVVATNTKSKPVKVKVLKSKVKQVPPIDIIGTTYTASSRSNVRGGPSTDYVVVGSLDADKPVNVVGKVKNSNWFLIAEDGVGSGFVSSSLLNPAPTAVIEPADVNFAASDITEEEVASSTLCRSIENSVTLPDGTTESETITACQGPNGWEVQPVA